MTAEPAPLTVRSRRARRRHMVGWLMEGLASLAALAALVVLALVVYAVIRRGFPALSKEFFTSVPSTDAYGNPTGGVANSIIGSIIIVGIATLISIPFGVLIAIYDVEFAPPRARQVIQLALNVLAGVPSVVIGVFIFGLLVIGNGYSAYAASVALSIIMVPLIARSTEEVLALVPSHLREGGMALGATRARTVLTVILPTTFGGIVTGTVLAVARAAGETAPLLFTSAIFANAISTDPSKAMGSLPMVIYTDSEQPSQFAQQQAWGAALVLVTFVLLASIIGRVFAARNRRKVGRV